MENNSGAPSVAGWHDDPEDPNYRRYSNGRTWTGQRVAKDRTIELGSSKGYRPGGATPKDEAKTEPAPLPYQPLTRRERRALEAETLGRNQTIEITDEFEFESAVPTARSYAPAVAPSPFDEFIAPAKVKVPSAEDESAAPVVSEKHELSWEDDFDLSIEQLDEDDLENEAGSDELPSLDFEDFTATPATPEAVDAEKDDEEALPELGLPSLEADQDEDEELPSLSPREQMEDKPESKDDEDEESDDDDFLAEYVDLMEDDSDEERDADEPHKDEVNEESESELESEFASLPPVFSAPSYAAKPEPKVEKPVEDKPEPELSLADILDEGPEEQAAAQDAVTEKTPDSATVETEAEEPKREVPAYAAPATAKVAAPAKAEPVKAEPVKVETPAEAVKEADEADEDEPVFGFKSKLNHNFGNGEGTAHDTAMASATEAIPSPAKDEVKVDTSDAEQDDDDLEDEGDEPRQGIGSKFKSLFGRGRSKKVLDEDEDEDDDRDEDDSDEQKASDPVEHAEVAERPAPKVAPVTPAEDSEVDTDDDDRDDDEVDTDDDDDRDEDRDEDDDRDEDEGVEREEPQLRAGLFSSKKAKEDAAVEAELLDRLKELADRVAALKKEEVLTLDRIKKAKVEEAELKALVDHAHEEHELLDQLAKTRRKELETVHSDKEDDHFRDFIETHEQPSGSSEAASEDEITISAPASAEAHGDEDDDAPETSRLPELKLN